MNTSSLAIAIVFPVALLVSACSSTTRSADATAVTDQRLATNFTDQGIRVFHTLTGKLEKIEVSGQADAWKGNVDLQAEANTFHKTHPRRDHFRTLVAFMDPPLEGHVESLIMPDDFAK